MVVNSAFVLIKGFTILEFRFHFHFECIEEMQYVVGKDKGRVGTQIRCKGKHLQKQNQVLQSHRSVSEAKVSVT